MDIPLKFIELGLQIDRHFPGYVDAYYGDQRVRDAVAESDPCPLADLAAATDELVEALAADATLDAQRRDFLASEIGAMRTTTRIVAGDLPAFVDEVRALFDVEPSWVDESVFDSAHSAIDDVLPGTCTLAERVASFREQSRVPAGALTGVMQDLLAELRGKTSARFGLPEGEECEIAFVRDRPWGAYNWYLGGAKSRIDVNLDLPIEIWSLVQIAAHEAYPGHHTEHATKELRLFRQQGRAELSILLANTPSALISEGIAQCALEAVLSTAEIEEIFAECYAAAGRPRADAIRARDFLAARRQLESVPDNQGLLLYRDGGSDDDFVEYGVKYALTSQERERHHLKFLRDPLWRSYGYTYTLGRQLVEDFLGTAADSATAFAELLNTSFTPAQLRERILGCGGGRSS